MQNITQEKNTSTINPVKLAVLANRFETICREMTSVLQRAGRSSVLSMGRDFSVAIVTGDHQLLAAAESLPVHVLGIELQARAMATYHSILEAGDAYLDNDPYVGNTHHADHTILVPVIIEGKHLFTVCAKAHQADVGNSIPTTYFPHSKDLYEEGALNFPCVQIQKNYEDVEDIVRMCRRRIRVPEQWYGDYLATLGAARVGQKRIEALAEEMGAALLEEFSAAWLDYSEERVAAEIAKLPRAELLATAQLDPFPGIPDGLELKCEITIDPVERVLTVDLRDNPDAVAAGLNLTRATSVSSAAAGVFNSIDPEIPHNSGSSRRIQILLRQNGVVGIPVHPTSCSMATTTVADRVVNMVQSGLSQLGFGHGVAEGGLGMAPGIGQVSGHDLRLNGEPFVNQLMLGETGGAASSIADGWINYVLPVVNGLQYRDSVEIDEQKYPLYVYEQRLACDSEGAGRFRGAPGGLLSYGPSCGEMTVAYAADGYMTPPQGVQGGLEGGRAWVRHVKADGVVEDLPPVSQVVLREGERILTQHCGGGGYGDPKDRDRERVRKDVEEGLISLERAVSVYGFSPDDCN